MRKTILRQSPGCRNECGWREVGGGGEKEGKKGKRTVLLGRVDPRAKQQDAQCHFGSPAFVLVFLFCYREINLKLIIDVKYHFSKLD